MTDRALPGWAERAGVAVALIALVGWSFAERWSVLAATPFPLGVDGYFYPVQLRSLLETGELQYPASPLAFYLLAPFAAATDPITGAKLGAAVLGALIALPAYGVGAELGRDGDDAGRGPGLIAAALATSSAGSLYTSIEFVKNGIGLTIALAAVWLVLRALREPSRRRAALAIVGVAAALATHKMAAALVLGIAIPAAIAEAHGRGVLKLRAVPIAIGVGVLGVIAAIGIAMPRRFLSPGDLALLDGLFTSDAEWSLPVRAGKLWLSYEPLIAGVLAVIAAALLIVEPRGRARWLRVGSLAVVGGVLIAVVAALVRDGIASGAVAVAGLGLAIGGVTIRRRGGFVRLVANDQRSPIAGGVERDPDRSAGHAGTGRAVVAWSAIALALLIAVPWLDTTSGQGLAMRLRVIAYVPMALCGAVIARWLLRWLSTTSIPRVAAGAVIAVVIVMLHVGRRGEGRLPAHPALVAAAASVRIPEGGVAIVPERHIAFMVAWYARAPISIRPERIPEERRYRVLPLSFIGVGSQLDRALLEARRELRVIGVHPLHPNGMVVIDEASYRIVLERITGVERMRLDAWPTI